MKSKALEIGPGIEWNISRTSLIKPKSFLEITFTLSNCFLNVLIKVVFPLFGKPSTAITLFDSKENLLILLRSKASNFSKNVSTVAIFCNLLSKLFVVLSTKDAVSKQV
mmetsp:Transcript_33363/g.48359  ORF Transcript_33363/g.48359 Transcript_33363/m.48359 type:complete len:109 (-) Transcript_33363:183-509(-)